MSENKMSELIKASLDGIRDFADVENIFGKAITTQSGVTVIHLSKISIGFATGGIDFQSKRPISPTNFGGGSGSGVLITPVAFLTIGREGEINLINISSESDNSAKNRVADLIENSPVLIEKIKNALKT